MKNTSEITNTLSISEQREKLLKLNPDLIYGVYELLGENKKNISLKLVENIMTCYPNQLENLKIPKDCEDIKLINLGALRKGKVEDFEGNLYLEDKKIILVSNGVVEYIEGKTGKKHLIITLRDGGAADKLQYTTIAGRNVGENLIEELEREHFEEGPFLGKNEKGEYVLVIPKGNKDGKKYTKESLKFFLEKKYNLNPKNEEDSYFIKRFERNFPGIKYDELGNILKDIIENDRFLEYEWEIGNIPEIENDMKNIQIGENNLEAYSFFDKNNNTLEYRQIRKITKFPDNFQRLGKIHFLSKLYTESKIQNPRTFRIENACKNNVVPTIGEISKKVREKLKK